ncbi:DUF2742 domain-containing protein [Streptomyces sp. NPDC006172]|uniref:DUF2742 domain-containing protein n=1 Tax=Streptomyces sp. NPDC006172 TaxID=3154470 RepID=UPI00340FFC76
MTSRRSQDSPRPDLGRGPALRAVPDNAGAGEITALRANAQVFALGVKDWPAYGSAAWLRLHPQDPRVYVATLEAAELHRITEALRHANARTQAQATQRAAAEAAAARKNTMRTRDPHTLTATPGWPPIQIPGRPGEYLTYQEPSE